MRKWLTVVLGNVLAFYLASLCLPAVHAASSATFFAAGLILGLVNLLLRPFVLLVALPLNLLTLGIFTLIVNSWMVMLTGFLLPGLTISGFGTAFLVGLIVAVMNWVVKGLIKERPAI